MRHSLRLIAAALMLMVATDAYAQDDDVPKATPVAPQQPTKAKPIAKPNAAIRPLSVTVELVDKKTKLIGTLTDTTTLDMKTSFGVVSVPLTEVAGFRFPSEDDATTTLVMLNGDSITGATDVKLVTVETEWGLAQINGQSIQSILFVPSLVWDSTTGLNGKRWSLQEPKKAPAPAATARSTSPTQRTATQRTAAQPVRTSQPARTQSFSGSPQFSPGFGN